MDDILGTDRLANHRNPPAAPCRSTDIPTDHDDWSADGRRVTGEQARLGIRMLAHHIDQCPVNETTDADSVRVERTEAFVISLRDRYRQPCQSGIAPPSSV